MPDSSRDHYSRDSGPKPRHSVRSQADTAKKVRDTERSRDVEKDRDAKTVRNAEAAPDSSSTEAAKRPRDRVRFGRVMAPRATRAQFLAAVLCAVVGFAIVVQVNQAQSDGLANLRQADLVRLLDEVTQRGESLDRERQELEGQLRRLQESSSADEAAREAAIEARLTNAVLSGEAPVHGPGVVLRISGPVEASTMVNVLQELRNAGAEAMSINDTRVTVSTAFSLDGGVLTVSGDTLSEPYTWRAIGDPSTLQPALEIPGGALASLRSGGAEVSITSVQDVEVTAVREPPEPEFAVEVEQ